MIADDYPAAHPGDLEVLGADDWMVFARDADGRIWCRVCELDGEWLDAPHQGRADYGTPEHAADWAFILHAHQVHQESYRWHPATAPDTGAPLAEITVSRPYEPAAEWFARHSDQQD